MSEKIVIIGGGPGGYVAAIRLSKLGYKTILIEKERIGGVCLNKGCIPTKALYKSAEVLNMTKKLETFGIDFTGDTVLNVEKTQSRKNQIVETLVSGIEQLLQASSVEIIYGNAQMIDNYSLSVNGEVISFDNLIIATGSSSFIPPIKGVESKGVITSTELLNFEKVPETLVIVGGGVIGMEFAGIFASFGSKVTVLEALPTILPAMDGELVKRMKPILKKKGIEVMTSVMVNEIVEEDGLLKVKMTGKQGEIEVVGENVLISTGRKANVLGLGLENTDIILERKGIKVDEHFMTNVSGIYAIGDVNGIWQLAHAASAQGEYVAELIAGEDKGIGKFIPGCVFMFPEMASVGYTEEQLKEQGMNYKVSKSLFGGNAKAMTMGEGEGIIKVISDDEYKIVGVHIIGPHASDLIHEGLLACEKGMTVDDLKTVIHAHPTLSENFYESVMGLKGEAIHMIQLRR